MPRRLSYGERVLVTARAALRLLGQVCTLLVRFWRRTGCACWGDRFTLKTELTVTLPPSEVLDA